MSSKPQPIPLIKVWKDPETRLEVEGEAFPYMIDAHGPDDHGNFKCLVFFGPGQQPVDRLVHESELRRIGWL